MAIVRWDPWKELAGFERQFDELFGRMGRTRSAGGNPWAPALDVHQEGDTMVICADVAGVDPGKIDITVDDNVLTISGQREEDRKVEEGQWIRRERMTGQFRRSISLPPGIDPNQVKAEAKHGVIEVRVPRPQRNEPHRVQLTGSRGNGNRTQAIDVSSSDPESGSRSGSESQAESEGSAGAGSTRASKSTSKSTSRGSARKTSKSSRAR
jgi:HSP20 family protein